MVNIHDFHQCNVTNTHKHIKHTHTHIRHKGVHAILFYFISEGTKQGP